MLKTSRETMIKQTVNHPPHEKPKSVFARTNTLELNKIGQRQDWSTTYLILASLSRQKNQPLHMIGDFEAQNTSTTFILHTGSDK